ncbi:MAG TPA: glycosyltransferase family 9 protein [Desulfatiglandales bacterium]|nr:glycosyltransferase family 9 protein [Desulfatiglandales bacterium]
MRVLIIKLSAFGDIIHSLSVIDCLRAYSELYNRKVELHWLVEKKWSPILKNNPDVDNLIIINTRGWRRSLLSRTTWREIFSFWSKLRADRYDMVIDINGLLRSAILARISRTNQRIGFSKDSNFCRERHSVLFLDRTFSVSSGHVVDQTVRLLEKALDIEISKTILPYLPVNEDARREARGILVRNGLAPDRFAVIAAGGGWETKLLDEGLVAAICDCVSKNGIKAVLSWDGEDEKERAKRISGLAMGKVIELGDIPVDVFIELLRMSRLVIGPDTGAVHAASAVKTPTVSYYGPSSAAYSGPRRSTDRVVQISPDCGPCFKRRCKRSLCNNLDITKVLDEIEGQLKG